MVSQTGNRRLMRELNSKLILRTVRDYAPISQVEIAKKTRLSGGTVTSIMRDLNSQGFIEEVGFGKSSAGRRPILLRLNNQARFVIAFELTADRTMVAILDLSGTVVFRRLVRIASGMDAKAVLTKCCCTAKALLKKARVPRKKVQGVGVVVEGAVDVKEGRLILSVNLGWQNVAIREIVERKLKWPCVVESTAASMAVGEYLYGAGRKHKSVVILDIESGIGAVAIVEGRLLRGAHFLTGEIGHNLAVPNGNVCKCGKRGCLETVAAGPALVAKVRAAVSSGRGSTMDTSVLSCKDSQAVRMISEAAVIGDSLAKKILRDAARYIGIEAARMINFLDPEALILTGYVSHAGGQILVEMIRKTAIAHMLQEPQRTMEIKLGTMGRDAAMLGVSAIMCEELFGLALGNSSIA
jgi:predicted NBD/HSP70 family sugar kinase